jgi:hypothetical protein
MAIADSPCEYFLFDTGNDETISDSSIINNMLFYKLLAERK